MSAKILATKDGKTRSFSQETWKRLTEDKDKDGKKLGTRDGWKELSQTAAKQIEKDAAKKTADAAAGTTAEAPAPPAPIEGKTLLSKDMTADKALVELKKLETDSAVDAFVAGDTRKTVVTGAEKRKEELSSPDLQEGTATEGEAAAEEGAATEESTSEEAAE